MLCCRLRHLILAAGCLICAQLGVQFFWAWRVGPKGADLGNTRTLLGNATRPVDIAAVASEASGASVLLLGPLRGSTFESSELLRNVALALQGLGFQVRVLGPSDDSLQELRKLGLEAQLCQDLQNLAMGEELREDSLQSLISLKCEVHGTQVLMVFGDVWASTIAKHRKDDVGKLLWFFFPLDRCKGLQVDAVTQRSLALADHVIFLTAEERSAWQQPTSSKFHLFRPFLDVDRLHGDNVSGKFTVTLETPCCDVRPDYRRIQGALSERFGADWLLVVHATCGISNDEFPTGQHFLLMEDKERFYQHMRGANLYVSLVPSGPSLSIAYASSLGIPSLATSNDQLLRNGRDGYLLPLGEMPQFLAKINTSELRNVGLAARESSNLRFSLAAGQTRLGFLMDSLEEKTPRGTRIALFLQMHNASLWWSLSSCIEHVLLAAARGRDRSVDLFVITTSWANVATLRGLAEGLRKFAALRYVVVALGANKGADIGLFLQQLLFNVDLQLEVDLVFKLHSKRKEHWRRLLVDSLCGSVEVVTRHVEAMERSHNLGIIGPSKLTWGPDSQSFIELKLKKKGFNEVALRGMNVTWAVLDTASKFPNRKHWIICAGTFFWLRFSFISSWRATILPAIPQILALSGNYSTGCDKANVTSCLLAVGLERVLPTLVKASGGQVVEAASLRSPK